MASNSSGYITVSKNVCFSDISHWKKVVHVPSENTVFVSIMESGRYAVDIDLYRCFMKFDNSGHYKQQCKPVWMRHAHYKSDFLSVFQATRFSVDFFRGDCTETPLFKLFFSFVPQNRSLQKLPSGLWNCSVSYYPSIHHHVACNHETECEDRRDETEHCPFSSPECEGLLALCNQCYKLVKGLPVPADKKRINHFKEGTEYCNSLGATFSFPQCVFDWPFALRNPQRLHNVYVGFYASDMSLPSMYRHVISADRKVLHHSILNDIYFRHYGFKQCFAFSGKELRMMPCILELWPFLGLVCQFPVNRTEGHSPHTQRISLTIRHFPLLSRQHSLILCASGHVTYAFFICGSNPYKVCALQQSLQCNSSSKVSNVNIFYSAVPAFTCSDEQFTLSYTLVCDFIADCPDKSDESVCKHPVCLKAFTCRSGQCISYNKVCDQMSHCLDESDEDSCDQFIELIDHHIYIPFPALVNFDSVGLFKLNPLNSNDSCPDSHYRCLSDFKDCLPVYTRCNGMYDCLDHQDEEGCEDLRCPGFFRCRVSTTCVHNDHMCDGWPHCPMNDDELLCDLTCPVDCNCQGHVFLCMQPFSAVSFTQLRYLDATGSGMTLSDVNNHANLFHLILMRCSLTLLPKLVMFNLRLLDLSFNQFQHFNMTSLLGLQNLHALSLSNNPLTSVHLHNTAGSQQYTLSMLDLSYTLLHVFQTEYFSPFPKLQKLNLTSTSIHTISSKGFQFMSELTELHMGGSPVRTFPPHLLKGLNNLRVIVTDNYKICCKKILPYNFDHLSCHTPKSILSSCNDLLQSWTYRAFLWLIAALSVTGNAFCFSVRFFAKNMSSSSGFGVFVISLAMSDFLMGVYIVIIGGADEQFRGTYLHHDSAWKNSVMCKVAGVLSLLSSEVSALIIWIITLDRFVVLHFPFSTFRFHRMSAAVACLLIWLVGLFLALVPLLPVTSHWNFYGQTGVCIPLPISTQDFKGREYSFSILIGFNFVLFLFISVGQACVYWSIQINTMKTNTNRMSRDITVARRLITVAITDFMCWFPVGICGLLAVAGIVIPAEVNVALAIFVLPLNSAVNPFMYTLNTLAEKRKKSAENKLVKWLEFHAATATGL